ncbi:MAG: methylmalonyl Co-A mutase-associated GTPase MeaB [Bacteroidales bacterium]|jgi:LAO/AO transport system kinase|nr:methylmalonyl Co-A mutase-associated GTPase MeaB [Bacteroidales bacterium]
MDHHENNNKYKALAVNKGIAQPPAVNPRLKRIKRLQVKPSIYYVEEILKGNVTVLSQAITLIESNNSSHYQVAQEIIEKCLPYSDNSIRIGITGVPGVGKSTFIEALGLHLISKGEKLAILAIDPSSERSKGSILGDKTRMERLAQQANAYIRPSPSAGTLGGVARKTRETIILCEAAGFKNILIETVGVGQSETAVHSMVDFFLLLMLSGAGDELQGIKRGIMEMADAITINKADGSNINKAKIARSNYQNALHLFPPTPSGWQPKVVTCSAYEDTGVAELWDLISEYRDLVAENGYFEKRRQQQSKYWMYESINEQLKSDFYQHPDIKTTLTQAEEDVINDKTSSFVAAKALLDKYFKGLKE